MVRFVSMKKLKMPQEYIDKWKYSLESEWTLKDMIKDAQEDAYQLALDTAIEIVKEELNRKKK